MVSELVGEEQQLLPYKENYGPYVELSNVGYQSMLTSDINKCRMGHPS